ncbi:hypothetical protein OG592_43580 (plasmid) [Streptomyces avidinii]|uniref:hypothetical protein n=1 Tax=Streptomyces avidinii TaxID=1895 RepID=UPI002F909233|nr:hypothetical protein OG592_43580 [Streptomyces avidinii]
MEHKNLIGHDGAVHEGLLNGHTGFLIDVACDAGRYSVVHPYEKLDPARVTDTPLSCPSCVAANSPAAAQPHRGRLAHGYAEDVLAKADSRGYVPAKDDEGLRLAFESLAVENPPHRCLYTLIREHLTDMLTDRALAAPEGVPQVLVPYKRYTGGEVQAPVGPGDRLMYYSAAGGYFQYVRVEALEESPAGVVVTVREKEWPPFTWSAHELGRRFSKLDRAPMPSGAAER